MCKRAPCTTRLGCGRERSLPSSDMRKRVGRESYHSRRDRSRLSKALSISSHLAVLSDSRGIGCSMTEEKEPASPLGDFDGRLNMVYWVAKIWPTIPQSSTLITKIS